MQGTLKVHVASEAKQKLSLEITSLNHRNKPWVSLTIMLATAHTIELNGCWSVREKCQEIFNLTNPWSQLGTASFLILFFWELNSWITEAQGVLPNSSSNATRDEQKEKTLCIEREQSMMRVWMWRKKNSSHGIWQTELVDRTINFDYSIRFKKALINQSSFAIKNVLTIFTFSSKRGNIEGSS